MKALFDHVSQDCSKITTKKYSTSFSLGTRFLDKKFRSAIYGIYGFVRFADEIVDTFHEYDKPYLLQKFKEDTFEGIRMGISLNPIINSFQQVVNDFGIEDELISTFLNSMEMDLNPVDYNPELYETYILGSAEVVGLMCLRVFTNNDRALYDKLKPSAMKLGAAFQKINFLRDLKADYAVLGRTYFPSVDLTAFNAETKDKIEKEILEDFQAGYEGIKQLPKSSRFGVYIAYRYYTRLLQKIQKTPATTILNERIRITNNKKYALFVRSYIKHQLNII